MLTPGEMPWDIFPLDVWTPLHKRTALQLGAGGTRRLGAAAPRTCQRLTVTLGRDVDADHVLILPSRAAALRLVASVPARWCARSLCGIARRHGSPGRNPCRHRQPDRIPDRTRPHPGRAQPRRHPQHALRAGHPRCVDADRCAFLQRASRRLASLGQRHRRLVRRRRSRRKSVAGSEYPVRSEPIRAAWWSDRSASSRRPGSISPMWLRRRRLPNGCSPNRCWRAMKR